MLLSVRWGAVLLGGVSGLVTTALMATLTWAAAAALGATDPELIGLTLGVVCGQAVAGWVAGRRVSTAARYHGALAALALSALILFGSVRGGSPAGPGRMALLAGLAIVVGGLGGMAGGRARRTRRDA